MNRIYAWGLSLLLLSSGFAQEEAPPPPPERDLPQAEVVEPLPLNIKKILEVRTDEHRSVYTVSLDGKPDGQNISDLTTLISHFDVLRTNRQNGFLAKDFIQRVEFSHDVHNGIATVVIKYDPPEVAPDPPGAKKQPIDGKVAIR